MVGLQGQLKDFAMHIRAKTRRNPVFQKIFILTIVARNSWGTSELLAASNVGQVTHQKEWGTNSLQLLWILNAWIIWGILLRVFKAWDFSIWSVRFFSNWIFMAPIGSELVRKQIWCRIISLIESLNPALLPVWTRYSTTFCARCQCETILVFNKVQPKCSTLDLGEAGCLPLLCDSFSDVTQQAAHCCSQQGGSAAWLFCSTVSLLQMRT